MVKLIKTHRYFILFIFVYAIASIFLLPYYRFQINPDGISYISIAQKYLDLNFSDAINAYWSPLYSWLLVPAIFGGADPLLATKIISIPIGIVTLTGIYFLIIKLQLSEAISWAVIVPASLVVFYYGFYNITADLLVAAVFIWYLSLLYEKSYLNNKNMGIYCGVLGALAYFSKTYAFYFFIIHFALINIYYYFKYKENQKIIKNNFAIGMSVFLLISGGWIFLLSGKYKNMILGTSGSYNFNLTAPGSVHPMHSQGFLAPSNNTAVSAWEDPSYFNVSSWDPLRSRSTAIYFAKKIFGNTIGMVKIFFGFSKFYCWTVIFIIFTLFALITRGKYIFRKNIFLIAATIFLYPIGYALTVVEERYLIFGIILSLILAGIILESLSRIKKQPLAAKVIVLIFFVISFSIYPYNKIESRRGDGKRFYEISKIIKKSQNISGNVVSNKGSWSPVLYMCFYLDCRYWGESKKSMTEKEFIGEITEKKIDYFVLWKRLDSTITYESLLSSYERISFEGITEFDVYDLNKPVHFPSS